MCMHAQFLQLCLTLLDPMDCSPPSSSVHGILQTKILKCVTISSSRGSSQPRDQICVSCISYTAGRFFTRFFIHIQAYLIYCTLLHFEDILHLLQIEGLWQPCSEQVYRCHFSYGICLLCVFRTHFGNSHNIFDFFSIIVFVMVICDQ